MWALIFMFGAIGFPSLTGDGLASGPVDIGIGQQIITLREPLVARAAGARLIVYVHDRGTSDIGGNASLPAFEAVVPAGSVVGTLSDEHAPPITLTHDGYSFYRGYSGVVLRAVDMPRMVRYRRLEITAKVPLAGARFVWLNRGGLRVEDVAPAL